jgi:hypothetical protein
MLQGWLASDDPVKRAHATWRLAQSDVIPDDPVPPPLAESLEYPSLFQQAANAAHAVGSVVAAAVRGEPVTVPQEEQDRRLAICHTCEFWDAAQQRCSKCGCFGAWKTWLASQHCPLEPPKW